MLAGGGSSNRVYDNNQRLEKTYDTGSEIMHVFDHADRRVRRRFSNDNQTWYVYGIQGELLAYYDKNSTTPLKEYAYKDGAVFIIGEGSTMKWCVTDHLNSLRMIVSSDGSLSGIERHDYAPFGEELLAGVGARTTGRGYLAGGSGGITFTGQQRDIDTGLDYFGARFHHNVPGRFTSVDPAEGSLSLGNPQSFNRYSYVLNSPMILIDPDGRKPLRAQLKSMSSLEAWFRQRTANISGSNEANRLQGLNNTVGMGDVLGVYSKSFGFVDVKHFLTAASHVIAHREQAGTNFPNKVFSRLNALTSGAAEMVLGEGVEALQLAWGAVFKQIGWGAGEGLLGSSESGFLKAFIKSEDTVGNLLGVVFAVFYYKPDGPAIEEQISAFFRALEVQNPNDVPDIAFDPHWKIASHNLMQQIKRMISQKEPIKH